MNINIKVNEIKVADATYGSVVKKSKNDVELYLVTNYKNAENRCKILVINLAIGDAQWWDNNKIVYPVKDVELVVGGEQ